MKRLRTRKLVLATLIILTIFVQTVYAAPAELDSQDENPNGSRGLADHHPSDSGFASAQTQSINVTQDVWVSSLKLSLEKNNNPTGTGYAGIWGATGTHGTNAYPNGTVIANVSVDVSTLPGAQAWVDFNFTTLIHLSPGIYCVGYENPSAGNIDNVDYVNIYREAGGSHDGNEAYYSNGAWSTGAADKMGFFLYGYTSMNVTNEQLDSDATFSRDTPGWMNLTVSHGAEITYLTTVTAQVNTSGDVNNFTLRWTQATDTFTEVSDPDDICSLNATASTRVNLNSTHDQICFNFNITGGQSGDCDVEITTIDDYGNSDTDTYLAEFEFTYYNWNEEVSDTIDSAFNFWGLTDTLSKIQTLVTTVTTYFADAMVNIASLIVQQFRIITEIFTPFIRWFIRFVTFFINLFTYLHQLFNGTLTGASDLWTYIGISGWYEFVPVLMFLAWWHSWEQRSKTRGEITVLLGDVNAVMNITAYFMTMFNQVISIVVDYTFRLFDAIV